MTAPRPIRPIDGNALAKGVANECHLNNLQLNGERYIRYSAVAMLVRGASTLVREEKDSCLNAGTPDTPGGDHIGDTNKMVTADDVVEGVEWFDGKRHQSVSACFLSGDVEVGGAQSRCFSRKAVAAMLNAAETVTWPKGHRLAKPGTGATLLELLKRIEPILREYKNQNPKHQYNGREQDPMGVHSLVEEVKSAIESARGKA